MSKQAIRNAFWDIEVLVRKNLDMGYGGALYENPVELADGLTVHLELASPENLNDADP